jgi:hypothetical protein
VDGVTQEPYGQELEAHLPGRHARLKAQWYRPQPIRRVHIPTGQGKTRPIGEVGVRGPGGPGRRA